MLRFSDEIIPRYTKYRLAAHRLRSTGLISGCVVILSGEIFAPSSNAKVYRRMKSRGHWSPTPSRRRLLIVAFDELHNKSRSVAVMFQPE